MPRTRIGLALSTAMLTVLGTVGPATAAAAQPTPPPVPDNGVTAPAEPSGGSNGQQMGMLDGVLHGEGIVQTEKGPVRVAVQQGTASTVTGSSVTVRSDDGFTRTWTLDRKVKVLDHRNTLQPGALRAGADIAVAGVIPGASAAPRNSVAPYVAKIVLVHSSATASSAPAPAPAES